MRGRLVLAITVLALAGASVPACAQAAAVPPPPPPPPPLPPDLQALEQKMQALQLTSLSFVVRTGLVHDHPSHETSQLMSLLGLETTVSGEETLSPAAAEVKLSFFGAPLTLRIVGGITYLSSRQLVKTGDGVRWIRAPGGPAELFSSALPPRERPRPEPLQPSVGQPSYAEPPFAKLREILAGAREVRELGAGVADGQPVTRFLAPLRPSQLFSDRPPRPRRRFRRRLPLPPRPVPPTTLEVAFTASGLPVEFVLAVRGGPTAAEATLDFPAVNFPLVIEAPAAAETISIAQLRALAAHKHHRHRRHA
jgi:hypothetical protein